MLATFWHDLGVHARGCCMQKKSYWYLLPFEHNARTCQTDKQTDRHDKQTNRDHGTVAAIAIGKIACRLTTTTKKYCHYQPSYSPLAVRVAKLFLGVHLEPPFGERGGRRGSAIVPFERHRWWSSIGSPFWPLRCPFGRNLWRLSMMLTNLKVTIRNLSKWMLWKKCRLLSMTWL